MFSCDLKPLLRVRVGVDIHAYFSKNCFRTNQIAQIHTESQTHKMFSHEISEQTLTTTFMRNNNTLLAYLLGHCPNVLKNRQTNTEKRTFKYWTSSYINIYAQCD